MIENASSMDRPVSSPGRLTRARVIALAAVALLLLLGALAFPAIRRWSGAGRAAGRTHLSLRPAAGALLRPRGALAFPAIRRWPRADRAVDATPISIGTVTRGDLRRDV